MIKAFDDFGPEHGGAHPVWCYMPGRVTDTVAISIFIEPNNITRALVRAAFQSAMLGIYQEVYTHRNVNQIKESDPFYKIHGASTYTIDADGTIWAFDSHENPYYSFKHAAWRAHMDRNSIGRDYDRFIGKTTPPHDPSKAIYICV